MLHNSLNLARQVLDHVDFCNRYISQGSVETH